LDVIVVGIYFMWLGKEET